MGKKHKVLIMKCDEYDPVKIASIVKRGMDELGVKPTGNILLKPNAVIAHPDIFPYAFTRAEFLDGVLAAVIDRARNVKEIAVGEKSGITLPTRHIFKLAGFTKVLKKHGVKAYYFDELKQFPYKMKKKEKLRDTMFFPKPILECDFLVNLPKFKAHPWTTLTLSLKNFIGIQADRHRLVDHNCYLGHKIADLQEVIQPKFIAIDAITAGQKMMLTPTPFDMGAIVMGTNSCAVDTVCCHMVHVKPEDVDHLRNVSKRGYGPIKLSEIEVSGDFPLEQVRKKTKKFEICMERIDNYFGSDCNLRCTVGKFPGKHSPDYCWGGCPGAVQEAMHIMKAYYPNVYSEMKKIHYVVGKVDGPIDFKDDETILFVGDCTSWEGEIDGKHVKIESSFKNPDEVDEHKTKSNDLLLKTVKPLFHCIVNRNKRYLHVRGCTVSVGDHLHYFSFFGKMGNPNFDTRIVFPFILSYYKMHIVKFINRYVLMR